MSRTKGTANQTYFNKPGEVKEKVIKVRVSPAFVEIFDRAGNRSSMIKSMSKSRRIRYLIMKGLLNYCHPDDIALVQDELERT